MGIRDKPPKTGDVYYSRSCVLGELQAEVAIVLGADKRKTRFVRVITTEEDLDYLQVMRPWDTKRFLEEYWHAASYETPGRERVGQPGEPVDLTNAKFPSS
jgi:hypothetical protein